ncbi:hypothetical protein SAMN05216548_101459 [Faunimonas pinastri]|uniref:N-acyl amino acid synthase FeeM catalytic core domain-containing protein n=1 Tax=Faunimonas pinastri TaxID=1855383 RepID=A0A1H9ALJ5_9HYPH|nr:hypothetical protein [Faunimonas pinastri]SEP77445.1 hypothetical protein SAMN05216548_101459 [Faunimonas pinastri]
MSAAALASGPSLAERVTDLLERVDYRLAVTPEEKEAVYRLRYQAYLREGAIGPSFVKKLADRFEDSPNGYTFGVYIDGELASSLRIHVASQENSDTPAVDAFADILMPEIEAGKTIIDNNRFVADHNFSRAFPALPYVTVRLGYMASKFFDATLGLATVRKEHQAFYKRFFGFTSLAEPRFYPTLTKPLGLMSIYQPEVRDHAAKRYPFFWSSYTERRMLFERPVPMHRMPMPQRPHLVHEDARLNA